jgi:hypothetical protein
MLELTIEFQIMQWSVLDISGFCNGSTLSFYGASILVLGFMILSLSGLKKAAPGIGSPLG